MNKWEAIQAFWESFGIPAYDVNSVPDDAALPYITYTASIGEFEAPVPLSASIWYRSTSWRDISLKADEIGSGAHKILPVDGGYVFVTRGRPFAQRMSDPDETIKRININITAEFYTNFEGS